MIVTISFFDIILLVVLGLVLVLAVIGHIMGKVSRKPKVKYIEQPKEPPEEKRKREEAEFQKLRQNNPELAKKVWKRKILADIVTIAAFIGICVVLAVVFHR
jgi:hypothetical protein